MSDPYETAGKIRRNLHTIRNVWGATITLVHRQASDEPVTGSAASPSPVPTHVLDARRDCHRDLKLYTGIILDYVNGGGISTKVDALKVDDLARFLDVWAFLFAEQLHNPIVDRCARDMGRHADRLSGMIRGDQLHRYQVGRCPEMLASDGAAVDHAGLADHVFTRCAGNLWASMRRQDTMLPQSIVCDADPAHTWAPWQWAALGKRLEVPA